MLFVSPHLSSQLAAISQTSNLPPILTPQRSTAELRLVGVETSCSPLLTEERMPESNDLAMSRPRIRQNDLSAPALGWLQLHSTCVLAARKRIPGMWFYRVGLRQKKRECCNSLVVLGKHWVHTLGHLEIDDLPASVAARGVHNLFSAQNCLIHVLARHALDHFPPSPPRLSPFYHRLLATSDVFWFETQPPPKKGGPSRPQPPSDFRDTSHWLHGRRFSLLTGGSDVLEFVWCAVHLWL